MWEQSADGVVVKSLADDTTKETVSTPSASKANANSAVHWQLGILIFQVFGRFSAKVGPKTPLERRGSSCSAGCTKNQPRRPILRPFRGNSEFGNHPPRMNR